MPPSLLPPNAMPLERALEAGTARLADIDAPIAALWNPATMPLGDLPFLAWALSVDSWDPEWSEATKRDAVARSITLHRIKGTRMSVEAVLARFDELASIVEWHEASPRAPANTFEVHLPIIGMDGAASGTRVTAAFAERIVREVGRAKPLREHFTLVQRLPLEAAIGTLVTARVAALLRIEPTLVIDTSPEWDGYLQTEDGEPLQDPETGAFLDTTP
jgi:phage tail P2-like protein